MWGVDMHRKVREILVGRGMLRLYERGVEALKRLEYISERGSYYVFYFRSSEESRKRGAPAFYTVAVSGKGFKCTCTSAIMTSYAIGDERGWRSLCKHCVAAAIYLEERGLLSGEMAAALEEAADLALSESRPSAITS